MRSKLLFGVAIALSLSSSFAFASSDYYPPERIRCSLDNQNLHCNNFNRNYLTEDTTNADFPKSDELTFNFSTAVAYFTPDKSEARVFFTYKDADHKMVKLRTTQTSIKPDLSRGDWQQFKDDVYVCTAGYMSCPISNLPQRN